MLNSKQLDLIQNTIKKAIKASLDRPDCDFEKASELLNVMQKVDEERRKAWHEEKFGSYEKIVDRIFANDDIPF